MKIYALMENTPYAPQFAAEHGAGLTVLEGGEHWFHTEEQMALLESWVKEHLL